MDQPFRPCPHCGMPLVVLPSGQVTSPAVLGELNLILEVGEATIQEALGDPDQRAILTEHYMIEDLGLEDEPD